MRLAAHGELSEVEERGGGSEPHLPFIRKLVPLHLLRNE